MTAATQANPTTTQVHRVYIKATPEAIWTAITDPAWTARYGYGGRAEYELRPGGGYRAHASEEFLASGAPEIVVDGEVIEADPPRRLVQTWRMLMDPELQAEGFTRLTYEIEPAQYGGTRLTVTHELEHAPRLAALLAGENEASGAGGGWAWVLSDLKSVLETGAADRGLTAEAATTEPASASASASGWGSAWAPAPAGPAAPASRRSACSPPSGSCGSSTRRPTRRRSRASPGR